MNTHNDFLNNAVNDELETEGIENLTTDVCSNMQNDIEKMCLSLQNGTCGDGMFIVQTSCRLTYRGRASDGRA